MFDSKIFAVSGSWPNKRRPVLSDASLWAFSNIKRLIVIGSRPSDHYFRSVCLSVCLFVCLFVQFFSAVFDPISIKLGHVLSGSSCVP